MTDKQKLELMEAERKARAAADYLYRARTNPFPGYAEDELARAVAALAEALELAQAVAAKL